MLRQRFNTFRKLVVKETGGTIHEANAGEYYLFKAENRYIPAINGVLNNGKSVIYTEARKPESLDDSSQYFNDTRFIGIGKYDPNHYN